MTAPTSTSSTAAQEQNLINGFFASLAGLLGPLSPFAKAVSPAVLGLVTAVVNWAISGAFDAVSITSAALGLVLAVVVYLVPNKPAPAPAPPASG